MIFTPVSSSIQYILRLSGVRRKWARAGFRGQAWRGAAEPAESGPGRREGPAEGDASAVLPLVLAGRDALRGCCPRLTVTESVSVPSVSPAKCLVSKSDVKQGTLWTAHSRLGSWLWGSRWGSVKESPLSCGDSKKAGTRASEVREVIFLPRRAV